MAQKEGMCDCGLKRVTEKNPIPKYCHCILLHGMTVSRKRILQKSCVRQHCCVCLKHPIIKLALKLTKKGKEFDTKNFIIFLIKQFDWEKVWEDRPIESFEISSANANIENIHDRQIYCERCLYRTLESNSALRFGKNDEDFNFTIIFCGRHI